MSANVPESFFSSAKQDTTQETAEQSEAQLYLSASSDEELPSKPGIALDLLPIPEHLRNTYRFSNEPEVRKKEIETFLMLDKVAVASEKEDRKCSPVPSCSSSDSEIETPVPKKPKLNLKMSDKTKTQRRVGTNLSHGITKPAKQTKPEGMWNYVEQQLTKNLVIQVLPKPNFEFRYSKKMSMEAVSESSVLNVLKRFLSPTTTTVRLVDIQTERLGMVVFRRAIVRKRISPGKYSYALMPNLVITSNKDVFQKAPNSIWYQKKTTNNRSEEMKMPLPFKGNQSANILFQNTFGWDV